MKTIAIIIGISEYRDPAFSCIPGAQADAERFTLALDSWGLPKEWIYTLRNEKVTKNNVIKTFYDCRSNFDTEARLLFYFAGHGMRDADIANGIPESSLVLHDTSSVDPIASGLRLVELMRLIRTLRPAQVFLFIDACSLRLNSIENPLNDCEVLSTTTSKGLFCLLASGINKAYENANLPYGYFTQALLKALFELRNKRQSNCQDLAKKISDSMRAQALPVPEVYLIGSENIWPLEQSYKLESRSFKDSDQFVGRWDELEAIQEHLVTHPDPLIWIWGEGGMGKTVIAEQLQLKIPNSIYTSLPSGSTLLEQAVKAIIEQIRIKKSDLFFHRPPENSLLQILQFIQAKQPHTTLIIDHLDRLKEQDAASLLSAIDLISLPCILISRHPCPNHLFANRQSTLMMWKAPPLSQKAIENILLKDQLDPSLSYMLLHATKGNALNLRRMLVSLAGEEIPIQGQMSQEFKHCLTALAACGGFLNEMLFCKTFQIQFQILLTLEKLGLIRYTKQGCFPHDVLLDMVEENNWTLDLQQACHYWHLQIQETPFNVWGCRSFILLAMHIADCKPYKSSLSLCLETLSERENLKYLKDLAHIFKREQWEELLLKITEYLIDYEEYQLSGELLTMLLNSRQSSVKGLAWKYYSRRSVWLGDFDNCIAKGISFLQKCRSASIASAIRNDIGISHYLLGNMDSAETYFEENLRKNSFKDERELGISKLMLGFLYIWRAGDIARAKEYLDSSLHIFESTNSYSWSILVINGLSDYAFRQKRWQQALLYLNKAQEMAEALDHKAFLLFTLIDKAKNALYVHHVRSKEISILIDQIQNVLELVKMHSHNWVTIWAQNILAQLYARRCDRDGMQAMMEQLTPLSKSYKWPYIITLANLGHLAALDGDYENAKKWYLESLNLGIQLKSVIMLDEIRKDLSWCALPKSMAFEIGAIFEEKLAPLLPAERK